MRVSSFSPSSSLLRWAGPAGLVRCWRWIGLSTSFSGQAQTPLEKHENDFQSKKQQSTIIMTMIEVLAFREKANWNFTPKNGTDEVKQRWKVSLLFYEQGELSLAFFVCCHEIRCSNQTLRVLNEKEAQLRIVGLVDAILTRATCHSWRNMNGGQTVSWSNFTRQRRPLTGGLTMDYIDYCSRLGANLKYSPSNGKLKWRGARHILRDVAEDCSTQINNCIIITYKLVQLFRRPLVFTTSQDVPYVCWWTIIVTTTTTSITATNDNHGWSDILACILFNTM